MSRNYLVTLIILATACDGTATTTVPPGDGAANQPPTAPDVYIFPANPMTGDSLAARFAFEATDPDGDAITYSWVWIKDGETQTDLVTEEVPAGRIHRDEVWEVHARASDGESDGPSVEASVTVVNQPPALTLAWSVPAPSNDDVLLVVSTLSDADEDPTTLTYAWKLDGLPTGDFTDTITADRTTIGQRWHVDATADDGHGGTTAASLDVTIGNRLPMIDAFDVSPNPATATVPLVAQLAAHDPDGDTLLTSYAWTVDNVAYPATTAVIPAAATEPGQLWQATVTVDDGRGGITTAAATTVIVNHAPTVSDVTLSPSPAGNNQPLTATGFVSDVDADPLTRTWEFFRNGTLVQSGASAVLSANLTSPGDVWEADLTVTDGSVTVGPYPSNTVEISDSAPSAPGIAVMPHLPQTCDDLVCEVKTPSVDPDGTAVNYTFTWRRNGVAWFGAVDSTYVVGDTISYIWLTSGDEWECEVTPQSGVLTGAAGTSNVSVGSGSRVDSFAIHANTIADVLLLVDSSSSMSAEQTKLKAALPTLLTVLDGASVDYHVGVVTTDMKSATRSGKMIVGSNSKVYVEPVTASRSTVLVAMATVGVAGSKSERGLDATKAALSAPLVTSSNTGFLRANSVLGLLYVSDEPDLSTVQPSAYYTWLLGVRPSESTVPWALVGLAAGCGHIGDGYLDIVARYGGGRSSLCAATYTDAITMFADALIGRPRQLTLRREPDPTTIRVTSVSAIGTRSTLQPGSAWTYESETQSVRLTAAPTLNTTVEVAYDVLCGHVPTAADTGAPVTDTGVAAARHGAPLFPDSATPEVGDTGSADQEATAGVDAVCVDETDVCPLEDTGDTGDTSR